MLNYIAILAYGLAAYIGLYIAAFMVNSVTAILMATAGAFAAYAFQTFETMRPEGSPMPITQSLLWWAAIALGVLSGLISITNGMN